MKSFGSNLLFSTLARARLPEAFCKGVVVDFQLRDLRQIFVKTQIGIRKIFVKSQIYGKYRMRDLRNQFSAKNSKFELCDQILRHII